MNHPVLEFLPEPELEFAAHERHVDIRYGLMHSGPLDKYMAAAPKLIRLGLVGTAETTAGVQSWLENAPATELPPRRAGSLTFFPAFLGFRAALLLIHR